MSWDIILFNSTQKITSPEDIDEACLTPTDFGGILDAYFITIIKDGNHRTVLRENFELTYFVDNEPVTNTIVNLYGKYGLFEIAALAKRQNWQIFDTGIDCLLDLENPANNGYEKFSTYLHQILEKKEISV